MPALEFSRPVNVARLGGGLDQSIEAKPAERIAVAERLRIPAVASLAASFDVRPETGRLIEVEGTLRARVTQTCVVSGDEFESDIRHAVKALYGHETPGAEPDPQSEWDDIEPVENGEIDLGELAVQYLALALDPYPRKPGAVLPEVDGKVKRQNPFSVLDGLKRD